MMMPIAFRQKEIKRVIHVNAKTKQVDMLKRIVGSTCHSSENHRVVRKTAGLHYSQSDTDKYWQ